VMLNAPFREYVKTPIMQPKSLSYSKKVGQFRRLINDRRVDLNLSQVKDFFEVGTSEIGTSEIGTSEASTREPGSLEVGSHEEGSLEVGSHEEGSLEVGSH